MFFVDIYQKVNDDEPLRIRSYEFVGLDDFFNAYSAVIRQYACQIKGGKVRVVSGELNLEEKVR